MFSSRAFCPFISINNSRQTSLEISLFYHFVLAFLCTNRLDVFSLHKRRHRLEALALLRVEVGTVQQHGTWKEKNTDKLDKHCFNEMMNTWISYIILNDQFNWLQRCTGTAGVRVRIETSLIFFRLFSQLHRSRIYLWWPFLHQLYIKTVLTFFSKFADTPFKKEINVLWVSKTRLNFTPKITANLNISAKY